MKNIASIVAMFLATALLGPDHASAWLIQATHSVVTASVVLAADNARNASGAPADTISSLTFPFPITTGGGVSEPERVIFWNRGSSSLSLTGISYTGPFSTGVTNCSGTLAANAYCYDWINYTPTAIGPQRTAQSANPESTENRRSKRGFDCHWKTAPLPLISQD